MKKEYKEGKGPWVTKTERVREKALELIGRGGPEGGTVK